MERQIENIKREYPNAKIIKEIFTGRKIDGRYEFNKLLKMVKSGDTIIFDSVSRMSRNAEDGTHIYFELFDKGINLIFLKEGYINTEVYAETLQKKIDMIGDEVVDAILAGVNESLRLLAKRQIRIAFEQSEKEVEDLRQRTREGLREAKARGRQIGSIKGSVYHTKKSEDAKKVIKQHSKSFGGSLKDSEVIKLAGISEKTYYKYKKELFEALQKAGDGDGKVQKEI